MDEALTGAAAARNPAPAGAGEAVTVPTPHRSALEAPLFGVSAVRLVLIALAGGAGLFLAWMAANTLFLLFGAVLFAALLDGCTRGLGKVLPVGRGWNLGIVSVGFALVLAALLLWSGYSVAQQVDQFWNALNQQLQLLQHGMTELGLTPPPQSGATPSIADLFRFLFPNPNQFVGEAQGAFSRTLGGVGDAAIVVMIGFFVALDPAAYRRAILDFLPLRRQKSVALFLDHAAACLRRWLMSQLIGMVLLAVLTWIALAALGVPSAVLLGVQAGLLAFVPYLGAVVAAVPIALMTLPLGNSALLIALGLYVIIHTVVGNVILPVIQNRTLHLPPALALASVTLFGVLFGVASVAVATPVVLVIREAVLWFREHPDGTDTTAQLSQRNEVS